MRFKKLISITLAVSLTLGIFSGLPPLRETTSITKEAEAADGVHKAWCWDTQAEFVKYVKKHYKDKYGTVFDANGGHVFTNGNLKIDLSEKIPIPGTKTKVCKWWWFTTVDKYGDSRSSSTGTTHKIYEDPKKGTSSSPNRWATQKLSASPEKNDAGSAANGTIFPCYELGGAKGKFKVDLGGTVGNNYGVSMYVINIESWLKNDTKKGFGKWPNKKTSNGKTIVTMFFNAITKTHHVGAGEHRAALPNLNTKKAWKKATTNMGIYDRAKKSGDDFEYDQHYNIKVEFDFGELEKKDYPTHLIIESRVANGSTTYAKTYTNSQFQWAGSNVISDLQKADRRGGYYKDITSKEYDQFKKGSAFSVTKGLINALSQNGQLLLRGVRLERYAVDKTKSENDKDTKNQKIITKSYSKGQTSAAKKAGYEYGDVAHVYLRCNADTLRALAKNSKNTTKEFSKKNKNLDKGCVDKNTIETKDGKIKVEDEGKFYEIGGEPKGKDIKITKKSSGKTTKEWDNGNTLGKGDFGNKEGAITYQQFIDYVSQLNFKIHPYEEYDNSNEKDKKVYEDHLVFIWERAVEPKLSMNTEVVSYDSDSGKYEGVTSGDHALNVPMSEMSKAYNVAKTMDTLGKLVPSNNNLTLDDFLKKKIDELITDGDKHDKDYYYERLLYSTGDAVPAILSDIRVSYTDKDGTKIVKSRTDYLDEKETGWDPITRSKDITVPAIWKEEVTKKENDEEKVETKPHDVNYYVWDGNNSTIENYLSRAKTLLTTNWDIEADLTKKMTITYVYVTPKTLTTQVNYVDVKNGDKTTTHFLFTDNEKDKFSTSVKNGLSTSEPTKFDRTKAMQDSLTKTDLSSDTAGSGGKKDKGNTGVYEPTEFKALVNTGSESVKIPVSVQKIYGIYSFT